MKGTCQEAASDQEDHSPAVIVHLFCPARPQVSPGPDRRVGRPDPPRTQAAGARDKGAAGAGPRPGGIGSGGVAGRGRDGRDRDKEDGGPWSADGEPSPAKEPGTVDRDRHASKGASLVHSKR